MLASRWLKSHEQEEADEKRQDARPGLYHRFTTGWEWFYSRVEGLYRHILDRSLEHHPVVICLGVMTLLTSISVAMSKPPAEKLLLAAPLVGIGYLVLLLIWFGISRLDGTLRWVLGIVGVPVSLVLAIVFGIIIGTVAKAPGYPVMAMLVLMLSSIGVMLSLSRKKSAGEARAALVPMAVGTIALLAVGLISCRFDFGFAPAVDQGQFNVSVEREVGTSLEQTNRTCRLIEDVR